ncbi:MAG: hypothetical protein GX575_29600 [Candidatus Anammoximicrobium sp.]|jgi:hypothetical protein|nr:hypothetical protein [Candidatus Anammoximicrobium sp.]
MNQRVRKTHQQFMDACNQEARRVLLNRRIVEVRYLTPDECQRQMWSFTGVAMVLDDGTTVYPARDAEGNDAGALHGVSGDGTDFVLPEILCRS